MNGLDPFPKPTHDRNGHTVAECLVAGAIGGGFASEWNQRVIIGEALQAFALTGGEAADCGADKRADLLRGANGRADFAGIHALRATGLWLKGHRRGTAGAISIAPYGPAHITNINIRAARLEGQHMRLIPAALGGTQGGCLFSPYLSRRAAFITRTVL